MDKNQLKDMKELFKLAVDMLDNQIKHAKNMEESFRLQAKISEVNKRQQKKVINQLDSLLKESKRKVDMEDSYSCLEEV